ncbi:MAG: hypothetical protein R3C26_04815 [Calditrichia bacterium]
MLDRAISSTAAATSLACADCCRALLARLLVLVDISDVESATMYAVSTDFWSVSLIE